MQASHDSQKSAEGSQGSSVALGAAPAASQGSSVEYELSQEDVGPHRTASYLARLGQNFNAAGVGFFLSIFADLSQSNVAPQLQASLQRCKDVFGATAVGLYSNSAGLEQYDPQAS
ncbi:hypothetical protein HaLaN_13458 [Haematococcus lacustris]|uniref:Uncharacterized protein n=1 Tax=Haematococcus lacustris TaxID=44745 RepID=A0A699ZCK1_HAELA|nr:hypothetical protein HaLaN_13458 [Haematococcus lacustris]